VICEVLQDDGAPARFPFLQLFAQEHRVAMIAVDQVAEHRARLEREAVPVGAPLML
jgi:3,4-dihydroxy-2-butanone 4-phosphate synthase